MDTAYEVLGANGQADLENIGGVGTKAKWANKWAEEVLKLWRWQWEDGPDADWVKAQKTLLSARSSEHRANL